MKPSTTFNIAWIALLTITMLATLNHTVLSVVIPDEATLFIGRVSMADAPGILLER